MPRYTGRSEPLIEFDMNDWVPDTGFTVRLDKGMAA